MAIATWFSKFSFTVCAAMIAGTLADAAAAQQPSGQPTEHIQRSAGHMPDMSLGDAKDCLTVMDIAVLDLKQSPEMDPRMKTGTLFMAELYYELVKNKMPGSPPPYTTMAETSDLSLKLRMAKIRNAPTGPILDRYVETCMAYTQIAAQSMNAENQARKLP